MFQIFHDGESGDIAEVEGVFGVDVYHRDTPQEAIVAHIDPRYDHEIVMKNVEAHVEKVIAHREIRAVREQFMGGEKGDTITNKDYSAYGFTEAELNFWELSQPRISFSLGRFFRGIWNRITRQHEQ